MKEIYFDNNATTKLTSSFVKIIDSIPYGNPSSAHFLGYQARKELDLCCETIADYINADPIDSFVIFTSGGTESNNWICQYAISRGLRIYTTTIEHSSIESALHGYQNVEEIPLDEYGQINLSFIEKINEGLIFIHHVNSETGVIQNVQEIGNRKGENVIFAIDAAQSFGRAPIDTEEMKLDFVSASGHKFHAMKGVGFLWSQHKLPAFIKGGGQQYGLRSGTENLPGAVSVRVAAQERMEYFHVQIEHMQKLRDYFEEELTKQISVTEINCAHAERVCNTSSVYFKGVRNEVLLDFLDRQGVFVSKGSACLSNAGSSSKVIGNLFGAKVADSTLRFSFSKYNTKQEVDEVINILKKFDW